MLVRWKALVALGALLALSPPRLEAQCAPPDGLDGGPCCSSAQLNVPRPKFTQQSIGICWQNCNIAAVLPYQATWGALQPGLGAAGTAPCGWFQVAVSLSVGGIVHWRGNLRAIYARSWVEIAPSGLPYHVWRFLVNGDLSPTAAAGGIPCPVPSCVPAFNNRARFTGYVDYVLDCSTNTWQNAWMLTHACDSIDHAPGSPRAGVFHPDRAFTFVGPAAGFVVAPIMPVEAGGTGFESIRGWRVPPPGAVGPILCETEERVANAAINPVNQLCQCTAGTAQFVHSSLFVSGACGTLISGTAPGSFISMGIGSWTLPGVYPGVERLRWTTGNYTQTDACTGVTTNEVYFGVSTFQGWPANQYLSTGIAGPLLPTFVDQSNSKLFPGGTSTRNIPYKSDQVFSLNLP